VVIRDKTSVRGREPGAAKAFRRMRFKPATKAGQNVEFWQMLEVEFHLR